ncbi:hypothetical protein [Lysobacter sp. CA199]|uniref:hypothetical protein n=1 Tax=Lysobacter sp. CA199 TaxID=3455608 RepID=UPI003F8D88D6
MKSNGSMLMNGLLCGAIALAAVGSAGHAPSAEAQTLPNRPVLYCFVSPNNQPAPPGNLGRCATFYQGASSYRADFQVRNLPAGNYSYVWTNDNGLVLSCNTQNCSQTYRGGMPILDVVNVTYTDLATGVSNTLSRDVQINSPL